MLIHNNHSDTLIIVLHEIYGINNHIIKVCNQLAKRNYDVMAPNLLSNEMVFPYHQEEVAYSYFMDKVGFQSGLEQVQQLLCQKRSQYKKIYVLGYSIGATLAWLVSQTGLCDGVVGFYGSRIREHLAVVPVCPTLLFFPSKEKSFAVDELLIKLSRVHTGRVEKLAGKHGFADPFSKHYNKQSACAASKKIVSFMKVVMAK